MIKHSPMITVLFIINLSLLSLLGALFLFSNVGTVSELSDINFTPSELNENNGFIEDEAVDEHAVDYEMIVAKALFHQTRKRIEKKPLPKARVVEVRSVPISDFLLKGIVFAEDGKSVAYLINQRSEQEYGLRVDETVEGWKIRKIDRNYINLENGGQLATLNLINEN